MKVFLMLVGTTLFLWQPTLAQEKSGDAEALAAADDPAPPTQVKVYKSAYCGCCANWVEHLRSEGFAVEVQETEELARIKSELGVPFHLESCHTAEVEGYLVEGHVPADAIVRLLTERPDIRGIAVQGMPAGSPGMETSDGRVDPFSIIAFDAEGQTSVYEAR